MTQAIKMDLDWPLMQNNITGADIEAVIEFLKTGPILTQSRNVRQFEENWSQWVGMKYSVFVNSGSSANLLSMNILKLLYGPGEIIVSPFGWVSDIASVIQCGFTPVFADIDPKTLCMKDSLVIEKMNEKTRGVLFVHAQGFNGLTDRLLAELEKRSIPLVEDVCESHGANFRGRKCGSFGFMSNFSFYYAHHLSTIEGGMICTNDDKVYQMLRMLRSHGMIRETTGGDIKADYIANHPDLNAEFIFAFPAYNVRNTEIGAVMGLSQLPRLDAEIQKRNSNFKLFLEGLNPERFRVDFELAGSSNYALNLVLRNPDQGLMDRIMAGLREAHVEFRRGSAGGGNQLRQPYLKQIAGPDEHRKYPELDHVHFFGMYIGNFPDLEQGKIRQLCQMLNSF